jgi:sarcosine oxidase/L-pipecolate oxidase
VRRMLLTMIAVQDRHGGEGKIMDFHDVKGWTSGKGDRVPNVDPAKDSKTCNAM